MADLFSCPFCGGSDVSPSSFDVKCMECGVEMPGGTERAIAAWNRRAPSPDMREAVEALTARLDELCAIRCQNDMGFDRETGPLGCRLDGDGTGCLCAAHVPAMRDAASMLRSLTGAKP